MHPKSTIGGLRTWLLGLCYQRAARRFITSTFLSNTPYVGHISKRKLVHKSPFFLIIAAMLHLPPPPAPPAGSLTKLMLPVSARASSCQFHHLFEALS